MNAVLEIVVLPLVLLTALLVIAVVTNPSAGWLLLAALVVIPGSIVGVVRLARHVETLSQNGKSRPH